MDLKGLVECGQNSPPNWAEWAICVQRHLQGPSTYRKMNHISIIYILIGFEWTTLHLWNFSWTSNLEFMKCVGMTCFPNMVELKDLYIFLLILEDTFKDYLSNVSKIAQISLNFSSNWQTCLEFALLLYIWF